jgi:hypothetical protein
MKSTQEQLGMRLYFRLLIFLGVALTLGACEKETTSRFLSKPEQAALGTVDGIASAPQTKPEVTIAPTGSAGVGGAAGALIYGIADGFRMADAKTKAAPIIEALQGFDFQADLLAATTAKLGSLSNVKVVVRPTVNWGGNRSSAKNLYDESKDASVLFLGAAYYFNSGNLVLSAAAAIYPKSPELKQFRPKPNDKDPLDRGNAIYFNTLYAVRSSITPANVRTNLADAINQIAAQLAADLDRTR